MATKYNPERRAWRGRSYKKEGRNIRSMKYSNSELQRSWEWKADVAVR